MKEVGKVKVDQNAEVPLSTVVGKFYVTIAAVKAHVVECRLLIL